MAFGGSQKDCLSTTLSVNCDSSETSPAVSDIKLHENEHLSAEILKKQDELFSVKKNHYDDILSNKVCDCKFNDFADLNVSERSEEINQSSDSLSSSASISDSDLTSTDSEDSLALSESESITDVTPLNSPYCDSPLPQNRHVEHKIDDKSFSNSCRNVECEASDDKYHRPEMNVLMKAIEKLELEAKSNSELGFCKNLMRHRASSFSSEEAKCVEIENQRLFKRVISQQKRIRSMYSTSSPAGCKNMSCRHQDGVMSDGDISRNPLKSGVGKVAKDGDKPQAHRKQKCMSHPSSFRHTCNHVIDKGVISDGLYSENSGKKRYATSSMKTVNPQKIEKSSEETKASRIEIQ